jgi:hypothetical protein
LEQRARVVEEQMRLAMVEGKLLLERFHGQSLLEQLTRQLADQTSAKT